LIDALARMEKTLMVLSWHRNDVDSTLLLDMIENDRTGG
jgi:hypothetical protein